MILSPMHKLLSFLWVWEHMSQETMKTSLVVLHYVHKTLILFPSRWSLILLFLSEVWIKKLTSNKQTMAEVEGSDY